MDKDKELLLGIDKIIAKTRNYYLDRHGSFTIKPIPVDAKGGRVLNKLAVGFDSEGDWIDGYYAWVNDPYLHSKGVRVEFARCYLTIKFSPLRFASESKVNFSSIDAEKLKTILDEILGRLDHLGVHTRIQDLVLHRLDVCMDSRDLCPTSELIDACTKPALALRKRGWRVAVEKDSLTVGNKEFSLCVYDKAQWCRDNDLGLPQYFLSGNWTRVEVRYTTPRKIENIGKIRFVDDLLRHYGVVADMYDNGVKLFQKYMPALQCIYGLPIEPSVQSKLERIWSLPGIQKSEQTSFLVGILTLEPHLVEKYGSIDGFFKWCIKKGHQSKSAIYQQRKKFYEIKRLLEIAGESQNVV